jgi:hypothetical protein
MSEDQLLAHLEREADKRGERLTVEERDGEWFAETRSPSGFGGMSVDLGINGPDRGTVMLRLARLIAGDYG